MEKPSVFLDEHHEALQKASKDLKAISNPHRLAIVCQIANKELSVGELVDAIGLSQSALSQHLALLRKSHILKTRREHQTIYYSIKNENILSIISLLYQIYCPV